MEVWETAPIKQTQVIFHRSLLTLYPEYFSLSLVSLRQNRNSDVAADKQAQREAT